MNDKTITLTLNVNEVQAILQALAKLPFEQVADLWFKIKSTAENQLAAANEASAQEPAGGTD